MLLPLLLPMPAPVASVTTQTPVHPSRHCPSPPLVVAALSHPPPSALVASSLLVGNGTYH